MKKLNIRARWGPRLLAFCLMVGLCTPWAAAEDSGGRATLKAEKPDSKGCFTVKLKVYDVQFNVFQFVLRYDPETVEPVDQNGAATTSFSRFAEPGRGADKWMTAIGTGIDTEKGLIDFTGYVTPGAADGGVVKADGEGTELYTFRFRKTGEKPVVLELATSGEGKAYQEYLPNGFGFYDAGEEQSVTAAIDLPADVGDSSSGSSGGSSGGSGGKKEETKPMTRDERLKGTVILLLGGPAASVEGKSTPIYPEEPGVTPYAHDDRTFVPLRFVAESLGAAVEWENDTQTAIIKAGNHTVRMQVSSTAYTVDGNAKVMDAAPEFKQDPGSANARTMVPIRFVAEALDRDVKWDQGNNAVIISPQAAPWDLKGSVEKELMSDTLLMLSPLARGFAGGNEGGGNNQ